MNGSLIIKNGSILTMDEAERARWLAVWGGKILDIGDGDGYEKYLSDDTVVIDAKDHTVLPGFIDNHFHLIITALGAQWVNMEGAKNFHAMGRRLKAAQAKDPGKPVIAAKLDWQDLDEKQMPDRLILDKYCKNIPAAVYSADYHLLSLNTCGMLFFKVPFALEGTGIDSKGMPTGIFTGPAGARLDTNILKTFTDEDISRSMEKIMPELFRLGLTTIAAMEGGKMNMDFYRDRDSEFIYNNGNRYPMTMELFYPTMDIDSVTEKGLKRIGGVLYVDGTIGARSAAISGEYADQPGTQGFLCIEPEILKSFAAECYRRDLQLSFDAIGDRAIDAVLDAFEYAREKYGTKDLRCRIEHAELINRKQMEKARELSVILSMQPAYEGRWGGRGKMYSQRLGDRYGLTNPFRELFDMGITVCGGSDSDVTSPDPLLGIHYAVNHPVESHRITLEEALRMYTSNGAYALFREKDIGSLTPGKNADIVLLDRNLEKAGTDKIKNAKVALTIKDGVILYEHG